MKKGCPFWTAHSDAHLLANYRFAPNATAAQTCARGIMLIIIYIIESETSIRRINSRDIVFT
jgi:hypothetical protein